jgi:hypothetical protein
MFRAFPVDLWAEVAFLCAFTELDARKSWPSFVLLKLTSAKRQFTVMVNVTVCVSDPDVPVIVIVCALALVLLEV